MLLTTIAIILVLVSMNYFQQYSDVKSLLLNLSTEIFGAVLLFLIVNNLFSLENNENSKLDNLISKVNENFSPLRTGSEVSSSYILSKIQPTNTERISILSYSLSPSIRKNREKISRAVKHGAKVRIIIINQAGPAIDLIKLNSGIKGDLMKTDFNASLEYLKDILDNKEKKGSIELRCVQWIPSCSMYIVENKNKEGNQARVGIYRPAIKAKNIHKYALHLRRSINKNEYDHFLEQYNLLWGDSEKIKL